MRTQGRFRAARKLAGVTSMQTFGQVLMLLRNVVIARALGPEQYGVAVTIIVVASLAELLSDFALEHQQVQRREAGRRDFQANLHAAAIFRAAILSIVLGLASGSLARFFGNELRLQYMLVGIPILIRSLGHLDSRRYMRKHITAPSQMIFVISQLLSLIVVGVCAIFIRDVNLVLIGLISQASSHSVASHVVARRRYAVRFEWQVQKDIFRFGLPFFPASILSMLVMQGERIAAARFLPPSLTASVAALATVVGGGVVLVHRIFQIYFLSRLSLSIRHVASARVVYVFRLMAVAGAFAYFGVLVLLGREIVGILFGAGFVLTAEVHNVACFAYALRLARNLLSVEVLARQQTALYLVLNAVAAAGIALGFASCAAFGSIALFFMIYAAGELIALALFFSLIGKFKRNSVPSIQ